MVVCATITAKEGSKTSVLLSRVPAGSSASPGAGELGEQVPSAGRDKLFITPIKTPHLSNHPSSKLLRQDALNSSLEKPTNGIWEYAYPS